MPDERPETKLASLFDSSVVRDEPAAEPERPAKAAPEPVKESPEPAKAAEPAPATDEPASESEAAAEPADDDAPSVETLSDLAEYLGVEVSELYNIRLPVTSADGERAEVSLGEWKDGYQSSQVTQKLQRELETKRAAIEQEYTQAQTRAAEGLQQVNALLNAAERQLVADYEGVDWNRLRQDDPADWAAKRQDFMERQNAINTAKNQAVTEAKRLQSEAAAKAQAQRASTLERERAALLRALPEWRDESKAKAEQAQLSEYLVSSGFDPDDVGSVSDHRVVVLARKAMLWDQRSKEGNEAKRKLVKVAPKRTLKPGAAQSKQDQQADAASQLRSRLKKTGDLRDFAALFQRS